MEPLRGFRMPTRVVVEPGGRRRLPQAVAQVGGETQDCRCFLVLDPGLAATPWPREVRSLLERAGARVATFDAVEPNPRSETVVALADEVRRHGAQVVIGLGGGSVLDAAKVAAMLASNGGCPEDYVGKDRYREPPLPFLALPTTCGTGSEVTWVSVISSLDSDRASVISSPGSVEGSVNRRTKISVKGETMFPDVALVDADFLQTLPSHLVAFTGLDALTHALEALTVTCSNPVSDALAERAAADLLEHLRAAVAGDPRARKAVMCAATVAGLAFGNADVAAVHCLSETLGGLYDVHHGMTNALLLTPVLRSHGAAVTEPLTRLAGRLGSHRPTVEGAEGLLEVIEALVRDLEVPGFAALEIPTEDYPEIARLAAANGSNPSNPRPMGEREYAEILDGF